LTSLGVALGVAMVVGVVASNVAVNAAFDEMAGRMAGGADFVVAGTEAGIPATLVEEIGERSDIVAHVTGHTEGQTIVEGRGGRMERALVLGLDFLGDDYFLALENTKGIPVSSDPIRFLNDPKALLIGSTFAARQELGIGDRVRMRTARGMETFHVAGVLRETGPSEAFGGQLIVMFLDAARLAFDRAGVVDRIEIALREDVDKEQGRKQLAGLVGDRGKVELPSERVAQVLRMGENLEGATRLQGLISLLVGLFLVYNTISISIAQRRRSLGLLRCIAGTRAQVGAVFFAEAAVTGVVGSALGVFGGEWLAKLTTHQFAQNFSSVYESITPAEPKVAGWLAVAGFLLGVGATLLAALVPIRKAVSASPVETVRTGKSGGGEVRSGRLLAAAVGTSLLGFAVSHVGMTQVAFAGVAMQLAAAAMATPAILRWLTPGVARAVGRWLGPSARLGVDHIERELGRSATTVGALVVATGMTIAITTYTFSYEESVREWLNGAMAGEILIVAGSPLLDQRRLAFAPEIAEPLQKVEGVANLNELRTLKISAYDMRIDVMSTGTEVYLSRIARGGRSLRRVLDGPSTLPRVALSHSQAVVVSESFARRTGLGAGDTVQLPSPTGVHTFAIAAVIADYSTTEGWILMDRKYATKFWKDERVDGLVVTVQPGAEVNAVADRLRRRFAQLGPQNEGLFVVTVQHFRENVLRTLRETLEVSKSSEVVALIVALLGVMGTTLAAALDRQRELGVLRALGATLMQAEWVLIAEAGYLGASAALIGALAAMPAALLFVDVVGIDVTGWSVPFRVPGWQALRILAGVISVALVGGAIPGWRLVRRNFTQALAFE
jgi:putative ABC transport system permease protein